MQGNQGNTTRAVESIYSASKATREILQEQLSVYTVQGNQGNTARAVEFIYSASVVYIRYKVQWEILEN